ncbi:MAG TPA: hypothetical protein PLD37_09735 [Usitatibacteraceae bacterium]|nr:hypothetical protein [Usitatibacteraceae bacterium]
MLSIASAAVYLWHDPPLKPYGGTWLGYTLGTIGALLILWLLWFGVRKRRYFARFATAQGWLSAHVYLGTALLVVATLHTGFELGWNVHTLAYILMVSVIVSGFYGVYIYMTVPGLMTANRGEDTLDGMILKIADLDKEIREKALSLPDQILKTVNQSLDGTRLGGSVGRILSGRDDACPTARAVRDLPEIGKRLSGDVAKLNHEVYTLLLQKNEILQRARRDLRFKARLDLWLYFHVPLSIALLASLTVHVISVFLYW